MDLTKLIPKETRFKLRQSGDEEFVMRPINLQDEIWLSEEYPGEEIGKVFEEINIKEISRIVFRLLDSESKKFFKKREVEIVDEDGDSESMELGGVALLQSLVSGWDEKAMLMEKLLENIGVSRPKMDEKDKDVKKKKRAVKKR